MTILRRIAEVVKDLKLLKVIMLDDIIAYTQSETVIVLDIKVSRAKNGSGERDITTIKKSIETEFQKEKIAFSQCCSTQIICNIFLN